MDRKYRHVNYILLEIVFLVVSLTKESSGLQCYDCSYFRLETNNDYLNTALSFLSQLSEEECQFKEENDYNEVNIKNCPAPQSGNEAKCTVIKGEVSTELDVPVLGDFPFTYYSVERKCIEVPRGDSRYKGCKSDLSSQGQELVRSIIEDGLGIGSLGSIEFSGEECYYDELNEQLTDSGHSSKFEFFLLFSLLLFIKLL